MNSNEDTALTPDETLKDNSQEAGQNSTIHDGLLNFRRFSEVMPLSNLKGRVVAEGPLWEVLVDTIREVLEDAGNPSMTHPVRGLIVADDPLFGLAAAQLFAAPEIGVPLEHHALRGRPRLSQVVALHGEFREFLRASQHLNHSTGPLLMLGWNASDLKSAEAALPQIEDSPALANGLIWLIRKDIADSEARNSHWGGVESWPVLADVASDAREILARTLLNLKLPEFIGVSSIPLAQDLLQSLLNDGYRFDQILGSLNTPFHGGFQRLVLRRKLSEYPVESNDFKERVLSREDSPRHAASLFLVSHFPDLTPAQFIELGDSLARSTDDFQVGTRWRRPPAIITDMVLSECHISFEKKNQWQASRAVLGSVQDDPTGILAAEHMRQQFDHQAALLKERYLRHLDAEWLLGHESDKIADQYCDLVAISLRADSADHGLLPSKRLRRIVYGPPWQTGKDDTDTVNRRMMSLARSIGRTPDLIETLVGTETNEQLHEVVAALCGSDLFTGEHESRPLIRYASAGVFWLIYAHFKGQLSLRSFPGLFNQGNDGDKQRRLDCLNQLRKFLYLRENHQTVTTNTQPSWLFTSPQALAMLVSDIAHCYKDIVGNGQEWVDTALLAEVGCSYLRKSLRYSTWLKLAPWIIPVATTSADVPANDLALARSLMDGRFEHWLIYPHLRPMESDGADPYSPLRLPKDEGRLQRRIVHTVLDALMGLGSFGTTEPVAINIWFRRALKQPPSAVYFIEFSSERLWEFLCTQQPNEDQKLLIGALTPVLRLFPMFLLMAATRDLDSIDDQRIRFMFSSALEQWLATQPKQGKLSPSQRLMLLVEQGLELQKQWKQAHEEIWITDDINWGSIISAMTDREDALIAFAEVLAPIARDSQPASQTDISEPLAQY